MADRTKPTSSGGNPDNPGKRSSNNMRSTITSTEQHALTLAKMALVAARENGENGHEDGRPAARGTANVLAEVVKAHPRHADELIAFDAALVACDPPSDAQPSAETQLIAESALTRAFAAVFPGVPALESVVESVVESVRSVQVAAAVSTVTPTTAAMAPMAPVVSLKALRQARGVTMRAVAERLGLGLDVLSTLEQGRVAVSSIPERLTRMLGEMLDTASIQIRAALEGQGTLAPAFQRSRSGATKGGQAQTFVDFAELVRQSPEMSASDKAAWLAAPDE